jgi:mRNA-degrading endonuclease RelE of RelBE toxin-antitoxin system
VVLTFLKLGYLRIVGGLTKSEITAIKSGIRALEDKKVHHEGIKEFFDKLLIMITPNENNTKLSSASNTKPISIKKDLDNASLESEKSFQFDEAPTSFHVDFFEGEEEFSDVLANIPHESPWLIGMSEGFIRSIKHADRRVLGHLLVGLTDLCRDPMIVRGNTIKPLGRELRGCWRYRIEKFRLIYKPDESTKKITLISVETRGRAYR